MQRQGKRRDFTSTLDRVQGQVQVTYRRLSELRLDPRNSRIHSARQIRQIAQSIQSFGFNVPILVDAQGRVIAGHGRVMACLQLGWTEVPTITLEHLSEAQVRAFMIADNRLAENSTWDDRLLAEQMKALSAIELEFDLEAIGFETAEIDLRIESLTLGRDQQEDDPADLLATIPDGPPVSRRGDLFILGRHRVYCSSALEQDAYAALMNDTRAAMIITDPPFNVSIQGNVSGLGAIRHRDFVTGLG